jgi:hypothetical protein
MRPSVGKLAVLLVSRGFDRRTNLVVAPEDSGSELWRLVQECLKCY